MSTTVAATQCGSCLPTCFLNVAARPASPRAPPGSLASGSTRRRSSEGAVVALADHADADDEFLAEGGVVAALGVPDDPQHSAEGDGTAQVVDHGSATRLQYQGLTPSVLLGGDRALALALTAKRSTGTNSVRRPRAGWHYPCRKEAPIGIPKEPHKLRAHKSPAPSQYPGCRAPASILQVPHWAQELEQALRAREVQDDRDRLVLRPSLVGHPGDPGCPTSSGMSRIA